MDVDVGQRLVGGVGQRADAGHDLRQVVRAGRHLLQQGPDLLGADELRHDRAAPLGGQVGQRRGQGAGVDAEADQLWRRRPAALDAAGGQCRRERRPRRPPASSGSSGTGSAPTSGCSGLAGPSGLREQRAQPGGAALDGRRGVVHLVQQTRGERAQGRHPLVLAEQPLLAGEPARGGHEQGPGRRRVGEQPVERLGADALHPDRAPGTHGGRARPAVGDAELADQVTGAAHVEQQVGARGLPADLQLAVGDHVHRVRRRALAHQHLARRQVHAAARRRPARRRRSSGSSANSRDPRSAAATSRPGAAVTDRPAARGRTAPPSRPPPRRTRCASPSRAGRRRRRTPRARRSPAAGAAPRAASRAAASRGRCR